MEIRPTPWTQRKTEMWAQALSAFNSRSHLASVPGMDLVLNDLLSPSSATRALKHLCVVPVAGDLPAAVWFEISLAASASAPNYEWGWDSLISAQRVQRALQRTHSANAHQAGSACGKGEGFHPPPLGELLVSHPCFPDTIKRAQRTVPPSPGSQASLYPYWWDRTWHGMLCFHHTLLQHKAANSQRCQGLRNTPSAVLWVESAQRGNTHQWLLKGTCWQYTMDGYFWECVIRKWFSL